MAASSLICHQDKTAGNLGIDIVRHCFCFLVVAQHLASSSRYSVETNQRLVEVSSWLDFSVPGFFLISGYLFCLPRSLGGFIRKQTTRLLVPYGLFVAIYASVFIAVGRVTLGDIAECRLSIQQFGMQLYFLPYLYLIGAGVAGILTVAGARPSRWTLLILLFVGVGLASIFPRNYSSGADGGQIFFYAVAYLCGMLMKRWPESGMSDKALIIAAFVGLTCMGFMDGRFFDLCFAALLLCIFLIAGMWLPSGRIPGSGGVFLLHTPVLMSLVSGGLMAMGVREISNASVTLPIVYLSALLATLSLLRWIPRSRGWLLE